MKNRKTVVVAFMLVAVMLLGVGYAAVTDNFTINGSAIITDAQANDAFNEDIRFEGIVVDNVVRGDVLASDNLGYTASVNIAQDSATYHVTGLKGQGDVKTITFRIKNYGDVDATLNFNAETAKTNDQSNVFEVTYDLVNGTALAAGASVDVTVTVKVINSVTAGVTGNFTFAFTADNPQPGQN